MPTHIFIQHGMWNEVANQNVRAFNVARDLYQPGDVPGDLSHSGDWGQYGFLQLGDYAGARQPGPRHSRTCRRRRSTRALNERGRASLARATSSKRRSGTCSRWRTIASTETIFANGMSAVHKGEQGCGRADAREATRAKAGAPASAAPAGPHADHGGAPAPAPPAGGVPTRAKAPRIMHHELAAIIALKAGQGDQAAALMKEAAQIEESMRPPNGAADPIKPAHEMLGEVLLEVGKPAEAATAFDACLMRMPNRARSLMGASRAHAAAGHKDLAEARYKTLKSFWKGASIAAPTTEAR